VAGGKLIASYVGQVEDLVVCICDVPNVEALVPFAGQMFILAFDNDIILAEPLKVHMEMAAKLLKEM
jgi:hypothetical protein